MALVTITYTIRDGKGAESTLTLYTTDTGKDLTTLQTAVQQLGIIIRGMITGQIVGASLCLNINPTSITGNNAPAANSDVEEGALFIFTTENGFSKRNRIPTFDETLIVAASSDVALDIVAVTDFISAMTTGGVDAVDDGGNPVSVRLTDQRGELLTELKESYEAFQSSGSRRR